MNERLTRWAGIATGLILITLHSSLMGCASGRSHTEGPYYVFAWPFFSHQEMKLRGGTTLGEEVKLAAAPGPGWLRLRQPGLDPYQRDRAAILAMAGDYRASFDFLETVVFGEAGKPARPYRSWGTERVYVAEDSGDYISLQHILVMFFIDEKGKVQGPMVQKHWRQDWRYEPKSMTEHRGNHRWEKRMLGEEERAGAWSQSVFHVDDTPRYASLGRWEHNSSFSSWTGGITWRPLPRREHTVRNDYHVIAGTNRHTILPGGRVHEQDNLKLVLDSAGSPDSALPYRSREQGVNRYEGIEGFDFSTGDKYWKATAPFWGHVRSHWTRRFESHPTVRIAEDCSGEPAFMAFFVYADSLVQGRKASPEELEAAAGRRVDCVLTEMPNPLQGKEKQ